MSLHTSEAKMSESRRVQWWVQGRVPCPPYFWTRLRPEGPNKIFFEIKPSSTPPLSESLEPPLES